MQVSYGPPGHKGVTQLVAIGDLETNWPHDDAEQNAMLLSGAVIGVGFLMGSSTVRNLGLGGALALLGASWLRSRRKVEVTQPK